jgi:cytolysin-activating lysine-acyltransferase
MAKLCDRGQTHEGRAGDRLAPRLSERDADLICLSQAHGDSLDADALGRQPLERAIACTPRPEAETLRIMSGVDFLAAYSPLHRRYPAGKLETRVAPSLTLGQFAYYTDPRGVPIAFCDWAWLSPQVLDEVLSTGRDLAADEFRCGGQPFFYEFLAPFGHCRPVVRDLRGLPFFKGHRIPAIRAEVRGETVDLRVAYFQF